MHTNKQRAIVMELLYQYEFHERSPFYIDHEKIDTNDYRFFTSIVEKYDDLVTTIDGYLVDYRYNRLSLVDRAIILIATYELMFETTPVSIIIDSAIILTKKFSNLDDEKQHKFNNKLLDNIAKGLNRK